MRTTDQNKNLSESFAKEVFNNHNIQFLQETLADDFVEHEVAAGMTPDKQGAIVWSPQLGMGLDNGGGGMQWGSAADDQQAYFPLTRGGPSGGMAALYSPRFHSPQ